MKDILTIILLLGAFVLLGWNASVLPKITKSWADKNKRDS